MANLFKRIAAWSKRSGGFGYDQESETGLYIAPIGLAETARMWIAIRWDDIHAATGEDYGSRYAVDVLLVDTQGGQVTAARECCGSEGKDDITPAEIAENLVMYGAYAPLHSDGGNAIHTLLAEALREAKTYQTDEEAREERLDGAPVNAIGSTPREFMTGDIGAAVSRGLAQGNPTAKVMAQMQNPIPQGAAVVAQIDYGIMGRSGIDDPIAYAMGFLAGYQGSEELTPREELADAYLKGREHGADVRLGRQPVPGWIS